MRISLTCDDIIHFKINSNDIFTEHEKRKEMLYKAHQKVFLHKTFPSCFKSLENEIKFGKNIFGQI